jgi:hypothetical protein
MISDELLALWLSPDNWSASGLYRAEADPRLIVRKRPPGIGWTLNFAHALAWPFVVALVAAVVAGQLVVQYLVPHVDPPWRIAALAPAVVVIGLAAWMSWRSARQEELF